MSNIFDDMYAAVDDAKLTMKAADAAINKIAYILCGRLRHADRSILTKLKRELQQFDAKKKEWKP